MQVIQTIIIYFPVQNYYFKFGLVNFNSATHQVMKKLFAILVLCLGITFELQDPYVKT